MDKILVVVFENEKKAYEGSLALEELRKEGSINLYAKAIIARDASGDVIVRQSSDTGPVGTAVGVLTGTLIGLFGGPVGVAIGAGVGMAGGILYNLAQIGLGEDYLYEIGQSLKPGKAAVVAEIWEEWILPVDTKMEGLDGVVLRRARRDSLDREIEWDITTLKSEIDELEFEYDRASGETKTKLQAKIETTRTKLQTTVDRIQARLEASQQEIRAKIDLFRVQAAKAHAERKAKLEKRIAELEAEDKRRNEQLKQVGEFIQEALKV